MPNACFIESAPLGVGTERNSKQAAMGLVGSERTICRPGDRSTTTVI